ncbi:nucleotidyltransferase family protein [Flammeovirga agarivorans]|uniref:Nucleotidyltransferase domain-containing protein n=1 Tax=Flammeovirga agarivorans TaxID=2726742 RepID=A0A7X8SHU7_9BACT|nr:nucleotidyltransferase domain-containing protein [Flammeovirga agarivorans]NLR90490.1 nucleotidyltransferase domain-containing protein [Flammeovirga agarivorans]
MLITNQFGIGDKSFSQLIETFRLYKDLDKASIFGSRALGNFRKGSDIDICIHGDFDSSLIFKVKEHIEEKTNIPYLIDLIDLKQLDNEKLIKHIKNNGIEIYHRP